MAAIDYDLHKLGWRAFQDLCAIILQQVLGQTFHTFADSNDAGRDGAFYGRWATQLSDDAPPVGEHISTVAQCKFSARPGGTLTPTMLSGELAKVDRLHSRGLCDAYIVLTNLSVTGNTEEWLKETVRSLGVQTCEILDGQWVSQQISKNAHLRRYVPRVYGLGDLSQILDERRLTQAKVLLSRLEADLATFVPTRAYRKAADALKEHHFVLLLGEPACGKSTIAATLAMAALDNWGCGVRRVDSAEELVSTWNPHESDQLFWIDDAFGGIRHDPMLTDGWARRMDQIMAAVRHGARVILTSRDYIYRDARRHLKEYAYPRLREQQIVVDVTDLDVSEKRQILYNHLKVGDQSRTILEVWRPHLRHVAAVVRFQPEVARRLSLQSFTRGVRLSRSEELIKFFQHPITFLGDVLRQLEPGARGALACVYMSGEELPAPIEFTTPLIDAVTRLGASLSDVSKAFPVLEGTFLRKVDNSHGDPVWRFRHPTIREGFAAVIAEDINSVSIFLDGLSDEELLQQVDCGGRVTRGTLVRVPASLYSRIVARVKPGGDERSSFGNRFANFLLHRCSSEFLRAWAVENRQEIEKMLGFASYIGAFWQPQVLGRLHKAGALPDDIRQAAVVKLSELGMEMLDSGWLDEPVVQLFADEEREELLYRIKAEILPNLDDEIDNSADGYFSDVDPEHRYSAAKDAIKAYRLAFAEDVEVVARLKEAEEYVLRAIEYADQDHEAPYSEASLVESPLSRIESADGRDEFDDIADGR